jgi:hypothetical protein
LKLKFLQAAVAGLMLSLCNLANAGLITTSNDLTSNYTNYDLVTFNELSFTDGTNITNQYNAFGLNVTPSLNYRANSGFVNANGAGLYNYGTSPWTTPFSFDFTSTVEAMGFYIVMNTDQNVTFEALLNGSVVESYNETWGDCCSTMSFRGFTGGIYDSMRVTMVSGNNNAMELDNVYFSNTTDVPEPSTLAIFALGIIGLSVRRFKKQ